jgi:hypothetical protein
MNQIAKNIRRERTAVFNASTPISTIEREAAVSPSVNSALVAKLLITNLLMSLPLRRAWTPFTIFLIREGTERELVAKIGFSRAGHKPGNRKAL